MDYKKLLRQTKNKKNLSVTLKETEGKGVGLFATKNINKGDVVAYYKIKVFREKDYESPTDFIYSFHVYRKNGDEYKRLIGDLYEGSFPEPINNIPFWGAFINEPTKSQRTNTEVDIDLKTNYSDKTYSSPGDTMVYKLVATKNIKPGEELLWYYGPNYSRNYAVGKN